MGRGSTSLWVQLTSSEVGRVLPPITPGGGYGGDSRYTDCPRIRPTCLPLRLRVAKAMRRDQELCCGAEDNG